jgi:hypothetical protein
MITVVKYYTYFISIKSFNYNINNDSIVNHHIYLKRLTLKGNIACVKRFSERVEAEIKLPMDRITNPNSMTGSEVPLLYIQHVRGVGNYVVFPILNQSKQSARISRLIGGSPKGKHFQKRSEFGISRNTKVWGRRRVHNTAFICRKGPSKFMIGDSWFEGQVIKNQFQKLLKDLDRKERVNNLTTIMSNRDFLVGCYLNIRSKSGNITKSFGHGMLDSIDINWFDEVTDTFKSGKFVFKPSRRTHISKYSGKLRPLIIPSFRDEIVQDGMRILLECIFNSQFYESFHVFKTRRGCHTVLNQIRLHFGKSNWFIEGDINQQHLSINYNILVNILREKIQDEPFIDLIYKYIRLGYGEKYDETISMKIRLMQGGLISSILFNIYMHPFDK